MSKYLFIVILTLGLSITAYAQSTIKGRIVDEAGKALPYATVTLLNPGDSTLRFFGVTNETGIYQIKSISKGDYIVQFSFVGMEMIYEYISIPSSNGGNFGDKVMKPSLMEEVTIIGEYIPINFKSDTVEYNAKAFLTTPDAVVEDLLKKIPGIEVDETGNVKALGEDVTKVLVDGKEFFGNDTKVAIKNLPASAIAKVQVYDKKSEEAEFMGIDDGNRDRTINLLLNEDNKRGYFGNLEVGGGVGGEDGDQIHYNANGKIYRFSSKLQTAVLGMSNNLNEFGYSGRNHGNFGQQVNGLNTTGAGGINLSYNVSKINRYFISYLGRSTNTILEQVRLTQNFSDLASYDQDRELEDDEKDSPHTINFGVRQSFNKNHKLTLDGDIEIASNDLLSQVYTLTSVEGVDVNSLTNELNISNIDINANAKAVYIAKFNAGKTQIKTNIYGLYEKNSEKNAWENTTTIFNPLAVDILDQYQNNDIEKLKLSANPTLVQQIKKFWYLNLNVDAGLTNEKLDRVQGNNLDNTIIDSVGANFNTYASFIRPGISISRNTSKSQINLTLGVGIDQLEKQLDGLEIGSESYLNFLPSFSYSSQYKKGKWLRVRYSSSVNMPTVSQLLPVTNTINSLSWYEGNSELTPEVRHSLNLNWSIFDQFSFTSFFARVGGSYTLNKIGLEQTTNVDFINLITPVNVPFNYNLYSMVYFSTPIRKLGMKINVNWYESWNKGISIVNFQDNINTNFTHSLKVSFENRRKEKWNVLVGGSVSLTDSEYSIAKSINNIYYNTSYFGELRFTPSKKFSIETKANMVNYNSESFDESISMPLLSAGISYYFMKGEKASFTLSGLDLLDKSENIQQVSEANYLMQQTSNTIGRLLMLSFKMRIGSK
jgi:Outer membrane protein beta-barrel family/Carboxypeptidase regulatory-like domain